MPERHNQFFFADLLLAWMPFLMVFIAVPIAIYVPNQIEFEYNLSTVATLMAIGAAMFIPLLLLYYFKQSFRAWIAHALFFLGVFILLSDIIAPLQWGELNGDEKLSEPLSITLLQASLAGGLVFLWITVPSRFVRAFGVPLVFTILTFQLLTLVRGLPEASASTSSQSDKPHNETVRALPNVYQFVFDAYSSSNFLGNLASTGLRDELEGFVFFPRNIANYPETDASVPSFMTGRFFGGGSFKQFQLDAKSGGLRRELQDAGYRISIYSPNRERFWMYDGADYVMTGQQLGERLGNTSAQRLAQVTFVRVAPNFLRRKTLDASETLLARVAEFEQLLARASGGRKNLHDYEFYKSLSVFLVRQFIADEKSRPGFGQYVYLHVILPHSPNAWDASCQVAAKSSYGEQSLCAVKLMGEIVAELKQLGRYDNSVVIFQSDHGIESSADSSDPAFDMFPPKIAQHVEMVNNYFSAEGLWRRFHALLAIKPPMAKKTSVRVSQAQTQLADIPATIYDLLDINAPAHEGRSVFSLSEASPREIHVFTGIHFTNKNGEGDILGRGVKELSLAHLSFTLGRGWQLFPDLKATHEGW